LLELRREPDEPLLELEELLFELDDEPPLELFPLRPFDSAMVDHLLAV
jgi:hypothetical protein